MEVGLISSQIKKAFRFDIDNIAKLFSMKQTKQL